MLQHFFLLTVPSDLVCQYGLDVAGDADADLIHVDGHVTTLAYQKDRIIIAELPDVTAVCGFSLAVRLKTDDGVTVLANVALEFGVSSTSSKKFRMQLKFGGAGEKVLIRDRDVSIFMNE